MAHIRKASYPVCPLCNEVVEIETANTDEKGRAVHEDCYVAAVTSHHQLMITAEHALSILSTSTPQRDRPAAKVKPS
jgi:hypothetical protein